MDDVLAEGIRSPNVSNNMWNRAPTLSITGPIMSKNLEIPLESIVD